MDVDKLLELLDNYVEAKAQDVVDRTLGRDRYGLDLLDAQDRLKAEIRKLLDPSGTQPPRFP